MENQNFEDEKEGPNSFIEVNLGEEDVTSQREPKYGTNGKVGRKMVRSSSVTEDEEKITFAWNDITVRTKEKKSKNYLVTKTKGIPSKVIVDNAFGCVNPGEVLAIMGASGAGKSTLLNSLTGRNLRGLTLTGDRLVNGIPVNPTTLTAVSAYIQQDDLFIGSLTPKEHLDFLSHVRMDKNLSAEARRKRVDDVIRELGLTKCKNTVIGVAGRFKGISGGESKRLAFASEVLTNPPLLFCDEPTSGLDSYMAQNVVETLKTLASNGKTIICTIHQPSSQVFALFDRVLFMAEGRPAYFGGIDQALKFFHRCGYPCPELFNPADHYVQVLAIMPGNEDHCREKVKTICHTFKESDEGKEILQEVSYQKSHRHNTPLLESQLKAKSPYRASWWRQFTALLWRSWLSVLKDPAIIKINLFQSIFIALLLGVVYLQQEYDQDGVFNISGVLFVIVTNITFSNVFAVINVFAMELPIFLRENKNGTYRTDVYFLTKQLAEAPIFLLTPCIFISILYWMVGLNPDIDRFFMCMLIAVVLVQVIISFGYLISCISSSLPMALGIGPPLIIPFLLFGGFFLRSGTAPVWLNWIEYISWFSYSFEALMINQWKDFDQEIICIERNVNTTVPIQEVQIPCGENFPPSLIDQCINGFFTLHPDLNVTVPLAAPCPFSSGSDVLEYNGLNPDNLAMDLGILVALMVSFRLIAFFSLLARAYKK